MESAEHSTFNSFDEAVKKKLNEIAFCISESEFISLAPKATRGKDNSAKKGYTYFTEFINKEIQEYWKMVCTELDLEKKVNELQSIKQKYSDSPEPKWRPKGGDPRSFLRNHHIKYLKISHEKLDAYKKELENELSAIQKDISNMEQQQKIILLSKTSEIKDLLTDRIKHLEKLISAQETRIAQLLKEDED